MKTYKTQASADRSKKISHLGGGGMPKPDMKPSMKPDMPGMKTDGKAKGGAAKSHKGKSHKKSTRPGPTAQELLAQPVPASGAMAGAGASDMRPAQAAPAGLGAMQQQPAFKSGGAAHRANGGRAHHMTAGAGSGEGRLEKIGKKP